MRLRYFDGSAGRWGSAILTLFAFSKRFRSRTSAWRNMAITGSFKTALCFRQARGCKTDADLQRAGKRIAMSYLKTV